MCDISIYGQMEADICYLQPVMGTGSAVLGVHTLNVEIVREFESDSETSFY